jgi:hypothetical protein
MWQNILWPRQQRWQQALVFGVPLAILELGFFVVSMAYSSRLLLLQAILLGLFLYLVIPAIAGYWFRFQQQREGRESGWVGFRVGCVGFAVFMLAVALIFAVMFMRYINTPPIFTPRAPHQWGLHDPSGELTTLATILGILALLNGLGMLLSTIGGRIGGALATWRTTHIHVRERRV